MFTSLALAASALIFHAGDAMPKKWYTLTGKHCSKLASLKFGTNVIVTFSKGRPQINGDGRGPVIIASSDTRCIIDFHYMTINQPSSANATAIYGNENEIMFAKPETPLPQP